MIMLAQAHLTSYIKYEENMLKIEQDIIKIFPVEKCQVYSQVVTQPYKHL